MRGWTMLLGLLDERRCECGMTGGELPCIMASGGASGSLPPCCSAWNEPATPSDASVGEDGVVRIKVWFAEFAVMVAAKKQMAVSHFAASNRYDSRFLRPMTGTSRAH